MTTRRRLLLLPALALSAVMAGVPGCSGRPAADSSATTTPTTSAAPTTTSPPRGTASPAATRLATAGTALTVLGELAVRGRAPRTGYTRGEFGPAWYDLDRNGCDTRNDVLRRDLRDVTVKAGTRGCIVLTGVLADPYTTRAVVFQRGPQSARVQVDHVVALSDAWQKGAQALTPNQRRRLANDPLNLLAVDGPTNEAKGDGDAATWLPPSRAYRCAYVARQVEVKRAYRLWVTSAEKAAVARVLTTCPEQGPPVVEPVFRVGGVRTSAPAPMSRPQQPPRPTGPRSPAGTDPPGPGAPEYATCADVRAAGRAPIRVGDPGFRDGFDRDHDGVGCE